MGCGVVNKKKIPVTEIIVNKPRGSIRLAPALFRKLSSEHYNQNYEEIQKLGSGAFGEVILSLHKPSGTKRAVKVISKMSLCGQQEDNEYLIKEFKILRELDHPHIIKCYEVFESEKNYYISTEYCPQGSLFSEIVKLKRFTEFQASEIIRQLLSSLLYCHKNQTVHRDIKPENIFLMESDPPYIKLGDFGNSIEFNNESRLQGCFGSAYYMAPEIFKGDYDEKCDIWSVGIILFILITGKAPYPGKTNQEILKHVKSSPFKPTKNLLKNISLTAADLLKQLLQIDPKSRISAEKALGHNWISKVKQDSRKNKEIIIYHLRNFHNQSILRQAVHVFITAQISSDQEMKHFKKCFEELDLNADGRISLDELKQEYIKVVPKEEAEIIASQVIERVDLDMNGEIDYTEFLAVCSERMKSVSLENLEIAFNMFDIDRSGFITVDEIKMALVGKSIENDNFWDGIMEEADTNGDGKIDLREFLVLMTTSVQNMKTIKMMQVLDKANVVVFNENLK